MIFTELISEIGLREKSFFTGKSAPPGDRDPHLDDRDHFAPRQGLFGLRVLPAARWQKGAKCSSAAG
jgi:hypothetical protein